MINQDLRRFVNESYIQDDYDILQEALIEEGATIDLYHIMKDIQKSHKARLNGMYNKLQENDIKGAKEDINEIINNLERAKAEVSRIDDSHFASKLGSVLLRLTTSIGKIGIGILSGFATSVGFDIVGKKIDKSNEKTFTQKNLKKQLIFASLSAIPGVIKAMKSEQETIAKREELINSEMKKGMNADEAKKKVGSLYKVSILQYLNSQIKDMRKIQVNIGTMHQDQED